MQFDIVGKAVRVLKLPTVNYDNHTIKVVPAQVGDVNSRFFEVHLYDDRGEIPFSQYNELYLGVTLPDDSVEYSVGEIDGDIGYVKLLSSMLQETGRLKCSVMLRGQDDNKEEVWLTSQTFYVTVLSSSVFDESQAGNDDDYNLLLGLIKDVEDLEENIETAEAARVEAENKRVEAEKGRVSAENQRVENENERIANENARKSAESARVTAENNRVKAEQARVSAENARDAAEDQRVENENERISNENARKGAESARESAEDARVKAEQGRVTAEQGRVSAENARDSAEDVRIENEKDRVAAENTRNSNEDTRESNETARQNAETGRVNAEKNRVSAETARESAEDERERAEADREDAESDRVAAETGRVNAERGRVTAEQGRVTAEQGRVTAENNRVTEFNEKIQECEDVTAAAQEVVDEAQTLGITGTVKYDKAQSLTDEQKAQARSNIGAASDSSVELIENNTTLIKNQSGGFAAGDGAETSSGAAIGDGASSTLGAAIGNSATEGGAGGAVGYRATTTGGGGAVGNAAKSVKGGAIGEMAEAFNGGAVGYGAESNGSGFAGGWRAIARGVDCVQLGQGTNSEQDTLQFRDYQICDANGNIPAERLSANSPVKSVNGKTGTVVLAPADIGAATSAQGEKADSATQPNKEQNWSANQNFNAGFSALNGNFSFSDPTNIGMEIGRKDGTAGTPYIDFHTDGNSGTDCNSRLLATGNQLQITASEGLTLNGNQVLSAIYSRVSFNLNTSYFKQAVDSSGNELTRIWRLFGSQSRVYWVSVNLVTTVQLNGGTSYYMINQFGNKGYEVVTCTVMANNNYVAGRGRINRGGDAFWLDVMVGQTIPAGTNITCSVFYLSYS